ncbi:MAG TPA: DUF3237 domain-containing protein [Terriglobia bacterium]|nr:DUF3237 domain-containing protein [Terriglobia bacterium]
MKILSVSLLCVFTMLTTMIFAQTPAAPKLELAFEIRAQVGKPDEVGAVPGGTRRVIPILGGTFTGPQVKGKILPGGTDHQLLQPDGFTQLEARYVLQTDQGEMIYVTNRGMRHGPADVLKRLNAGERVDPNLIYFRTAATLETSAPRLQWMARSIFVCVGERYPNEVVVRFYRVM